MAFQSRGSDPQRLLPETLEDRILGVVSQGAGGLLCLIGAAGWASLLTWSLNDPSLTHATGGVTRNLLGAPGAILSDLVLQTLGFAAVFVLLPPVIWGLELALARRVPDFRSKIALFPVAIVLLAGACSALPVPARWPLHHGMGGILGDVLFNMLNNLFAAINPQRSGLAAGLVFACTGFGALIQNLGLSGRDLAYLMQSMPGDRRAPALASWRAKLSTAGAWAADYAHRAPTPQPVGAFDVEQRPYPATPHGYFGPTGPREQQAYAERAFADFQLAPGRDGYRHTGDHAHTATNGGRAAAPSRLSRRCI